jgi:amino acid permease
MKKIAIILTLTPVVFFISWTIVYLIFEGLDFNHYWAFFRQSFSTPGEEAAFIRIYSLFITAAFLFFIFFGNLLKRKPKR